MEPNKTENPQVDAQKTFNEGVDKTATAAAEKAVKPALDAAATAEKAANAAQTTADTVKAAMGDVVKGMNDMADKFKSIGTVSKIGTPADSTFDLINDKKAELTALKGGATGSVSIPLDSDSYAAKALSFGSGTAANVALEHRDLEIQTNPHYQYSVAANIMNFTTGNDESVRYIRETTQTNAAAGKAHGAAFAEKSIPLSNFSEDIITMGERVVLNEENLADIAGLRSFVNVELMGDTIDLLDRYILTGTGSGNNQLNGFSQTGQHTNWADSSSFTDAGANNIDVLTRAVSQLAATNYKADLIIMHPDDFYGSEFTLAKSSQNEYVARQILMAAQTGVAPTFMGCKILITPAVASDAFYVLDSKKAAKLWNREGMELEFWRNGDDFINNQVTARIKCRKALTVGRPSGIIVGDFSQARTALAT